MSRQKTKQKKAPKIIKSSTQQFSPILDVRDGLIITKERQFIKILEFEPINFELRSPDEQDAIIARFSSAIKTWPKNTHIKIIGAKTDISGNLDDLEKCKERELDDGNSKCAQLIDDQIALLQRISRTRGVSHRFFVSFEYEGVCGMKKTPAFEDIVYAMNREAKNIAASLESCGNTLISTDDRDYILDVLYTTMCKKGSGEYSFSEIKEAVLARYEDHVGSPVPEEKINPNDFIVPERIDSRFSPDHLVIDGLYATYAYVPSASYPELVTGGWLQILFGYLEDIDVDFWIQKEDAAAIQRKLSMAIKLTRVRNISTDETSIDKEEIEGVIDSGFYIKQRLSDGDDFCYISTVITVYGNTQEQMEEKYDEMKDWMIRNEFDMRKLVFQQEDAYKACIPLAVPNKSIFRKSKRNIMSSQLGSCYPFTAYELNDSGGIFLGVNSRYGSPVFLNIFDTTKYQNANELIIGPSGSGKTYSLSLQLLRARQKGFPVYIIAPLKGTEFYRACSAIGGEIIRIAPGSAQNINIMEIRKADRADASLIDGDIATSGSILTDKIMQLDRFFTIMIPDLTIMEKQVLDDALIRTYAKFRISMDNKSLLDPNKNGKYKAMPVLGDLREELNPDKVIVDEDGTKRKVGEDGKRLFNVLGRYVSGSAKSFNMPTNVNLENKFVVVDVSDLTPEMLPLGMFIALDFVMDKAKQDRKKRKIIAIDEMWRLMKASPLSAEYVVECFKIIRGYAGSCIGATQDLSDVLSNEAGRTIINNTKIKLLLPMDGKEIENVASCIDITAGEAEALKNTGMRTGRRTPLLVANTNHVIVGIEASSTEHDLITTNASDLERIAKEKAKRKVW